MFKRAKWFTTIGSMACLAFASMGCRQDRPPTSAAPVARPTTRPATDALPATEPSHDAPPRQPVY